MPAFYTITMPARIEGCRAYAVWNLLPIFLQGKRISGVLYAALMTILWRAYRRHDNYGDPLCCTSVILNHSLSNSKSGVNEGRKFRSGNLSLHLCVIKANNNENESNIYKRRHEKYSTVRRYPVLLRAGYHHLNTAPIHYHQP